MKTVALSAGLFATLMLSGCSGLIKTHAVSEVQAGKVPAERLYAYQTPQDGYVPVTIIRDSGMMGSACFLSIEINKKLAARFDPGEGATFYVPGKVNFAVAGDPQGRGLCAIGYTPVIQHCTLDATVHNVFRLSSRQYRRPELESLDEADKFPCDD